MRRNKKNVEKCSNLNHRSPAGTYCKISHFTSHFTKSITIICGGRQTSTASHKSRPDNATIHFYKDGFEVREGLQILARRSSESFKELPQEGRWIQQITREMTKKTMVDRLSSFSIAQPEPFLDGLGGVLSPIERLDTVAQKSVPAIFKCSQCDKTYHTESGLRNHILGKHQFQPTKCDRGCRSDRLFLSHGSWQWHIKSRHDTDFPAIRCRFQSCGDPRSYTLWTRYYRHLKAKYSLRREEARVYNPNNLSKKGRQAPLRRSRYIHTSKLSEVKPDNKIQAL